MNRLPLVAALVTVGLVAGWLTYDWWTCLPPGRTAEYVGRASCAECHQQELAQWTGSDHDLAMDPATPELVLGDFDGTELEHHGVVSRLSVREDQYFVETEGPDGSRQEYVVKYVIGYWPLQQYLAETEPGRLQVLPVTWDVDEQEWYYANPDEPFGPSDPLHWTGVAQNWNHMCADCHVTDFAKNYDLDADAHDPSFFEMDVSCEACHGPGSLHVEIAESGGVFWDRRYGYGLVDTDAREGKAEMETCAPCHARRSRIYPGYQAGDRFLDHFGLSLLEEGLYHPDGQIDDEVYVYGSFTQSLMYRKGVRCTDCHNPHTTRVKFSGNSLCIQCHEARYNAPEHHHHPVDSEGASCVECHMPEQTYMGIDARRDHNIRVPRPDLTVKLGTPNACNNCHEKPEETAEWAAQKVVEWYGPQRAEDPHYGEILAAGRRGRPEAERALEKLAQNPDVGGIVRATAVSLLATRYQTPLSQRAIEAALQDEDPLVRAAATRAFEGPPPERNAAIRRARLLVPLLQDDIRLVRIEAARALAAVPSDVLSAQDRKRLDEALTEYRTGLLAEADQAGAHVNLAGLAADRGDVDEAIRELRTAIRLAPEQTGARSNLAQLLEERGETEQARVLREEERALIRRDAKLLPESATMQYRLGMIEYLLGNTSAAESALKRAGELDPAEAQYPMALALLYEKLQRWGDAVRAARRLVELQPNNAMFQQMLQNYERAQRATERPFGPLRPR